MRRSRWLAGIVGLAAAVVALPVSAQETLAADVRASIDRAVGEVLTKSGTPSASIAIVRNGAIAYVHAYGLARLEPRTPATEGMRYSIGSVSKQFTAAAIFMLAEDGRLSLDDHVDRWIPELTRSREVTIKQLLSMTSGYQDFWPQDYVMPGMLKPTTPQEILSGWAQKPLDFDPGTKWQYSNTNYVIAGLIVEKASGLSLVDFLKRRVFAPLQMTSIFNTDEAPLPDDEPGRHMRYALGPIRPAPKEGRGWMFAAGELAMTARDLARWDISMIDQTVLRPESYRQMQTEVLLNSGVGSRYGLGVVVGMADGRRQISHTGEVSGFTARNDVYPDERAAVVVLTNLDATSASTQIANRIAAIVFGIGDDAATKTATEQSRRLFEELQHGRIDRTLLTPNLSVYFTDQAIKDFASSLGPLGAPQEFAQQAQALRGGMTARRFRIRARDKILALTTFTMPDGKLEQYQIAAVE